jgi:hypothetical protein
MRTGIVTYKTEEEKWLKKHVPDAVWQRKNGRAGMGEGSIRVGRPSVVMVVQTTLDAPAAEWSLLWGKTHESGSPLG